MACWAPYYTWTLSGKGQSPIKTWGGFLVGKDGKPYLAHLTARRDLLGVFKKNYKVAAACLHVPLVGDMYEAPLYKSEPHEIFDGDIGISIPLPPQYSDEAGGRESQYVLLLVPRTVNMSDFSTLHQAEQEGVLIDEQKGGPP